MTKHVVLPRPAAGIFSVRADATDPNAALEMLNNAFAEFKETNNANLDKRDAVNDEKLAKINSAMDDFQSILDDHAKKLAASTLSGGSVAVRDPEYTEAFMAHFRSNNVQASLEKGADSEGGFLAPVEWDRTIIDKLVEISPMREIATVQTISKAGFKKLFNLRGTASGWVGEKTARTETNSPTFGELAFIPGEIYANPAATQQLLDDAEVDLEAWLAMEVQTEFAYREGLAFVAGDGSNKPRGFLTFATGGAAAAVNPLGAIGVTAAASATALATDEIQDLVYSLPSQFTANARFVMNRTTQGAVRKLKDGQGNYIWQPAYAAGQPATLNGYPVTEMQAMPDVAASGIPIAFGDFRRGYLIVDRPHRRVARYNCL
ncbi:MAG: phage major capsid protein, partial [Pseudomonadota bacterium]